MNTVMKTETDHSSVSVTMHKPRPIMLNFYLLCFRAMLKKLPIMLNIMPMTTAIMSQFVYDFIIFND